MHVGAFATPCALCIARQHGDTVQMALPSEVREPRRGRVEKKNH